MLVLWLLNAMAGALESRPESAGRVKAAVMQLLPPLLDGLHARRLSGLSDRGRSPEERHQLLSDFNNILVGTGAASVGAGTISQHWLAS